MTDPQTVAPPPVVPAGGKRYSKLLKSSRFPILAMLREMRNEDASGVFLRVVARTLGTALPIPLYPLSRLVGRERRLAFRVTSGWGADVCRICGLRLDVRGSFQPLPGRGHLLASNHLSPLDIPILYGVLPVLCGFVANRELGDLAVVRFWTLRAGGIFVKKDEASSRTETFRRMARALQRGDNLVLFPEGNMSRYGELEPFNRGGLAAAAAGGAVIVPVLLHGSREALGPGDFVIHRGRPVLVAFGEPIDTRELPRAERASIHELVHGRVAALRRLHVPEASPAAPTAD